MEADGAETEAAGDGGHGTPAPDAVQTTDAADPAEIDAVVELLTEVGIVSGRPRALLGAADRTSGAARLPVLTRSMAFLRDHHESLYFTRTRELAFLANVLAAGATVQGRAFTPAEASDAAASICNLGLERWCSSGSAVHGDGEAAHDEACLVDRNLVGAFRSGWSVLYRDVGLYVSDQLIGALDDVTSGDSTLIHDVRSFRRALVEQREAGTPWRARDDADVLTMLDATSAIAVRGLLDECPVVHEALTALLERRTSPVDPTGFRFISSTADIERIHAFVRALPAWWN